MHHLTADTFSKRHMPWRFGRRDHGDEGLRITFTLGDKRQRRDALKYLAEALRGNRIQWLKPEGEAWQLDLDRLRNTFPDFLAGEEWVTGLHIISPEVSISELREGKYATTLVEFSLMKEQAIRARPKRVFIGHGRSTVWLDLRELIVERLRLSHEESNRESAVGLATKERLEAMLDSSAFAILVLTAEDEHSDGTTHARENVIHEAGLFQGRHGFRRAIVMLEEGCAEFSNIAGITHIRFPRGDVRARSEDIRRVLEREGILGGG